MGKTVKSPFWIAAFAAKTVTCAEVPWNPVRLDAGQRKSRGTIRLLLITGKKRAPGIARGAA